MPTIVKQRNPIQIDDIRTGTSNYVEGKIESFLRFKHGELVFSSKLNMEMIVTDSGPNSITVSIERRKLIGKSKELSNLLGKKFNLVCVGFELHNAIIISCKQNPFVSFEIRYDFFTVQEARLQFSKQKIVLLKELYSSLGLDSRNIAFLR